MSSGLKGDDLVLWFIDYLHEVRHCTTLFHILFAQVGLGSQLPRFFWPCFAESRHELRTICYAKAVLPTSYMLSSHHLNSDSLLFASGGYGDVYQGTLDGMKVCTKRVHVYTQDTPQNTAKVNHCLMLSLPLSAATNQACTPSAERPWCGNT